MNHIPVHVFCGELESDAAPFDPQSLGPGPALVLHDAHKHGRGNSKPRDRHQHLDRQGGQHAHGGGDRRHHHPNRIAVGSGPERGDDKADQKWCDQQRGQRELVPSLLVPCLEERVG